MEQVYDAFGMPGQIAAEKSFGENVIIENFRNNKYFLFSIFKSQHSRPCLQAI